MTVSRLRLAALLTALTLCTSLVSAQAPSTPPPLPVTTVLAMLKVTPGVTRDAIMKVMQDEVRDTVLLYLDGHITQWYSRADSNGVVFMLDVSSVEAAKTMTDRLPLVKAGLASFDFIPLSPLNPLRVLLSPPAK